MSSFLIIVNPTAGRGKGRRSIPAVCAAMTHLGADLELIQTERPGQAIEIARQAATGDHEAVVAVGGDGTVMERSIQRRRNIFK